ncbi:MAG TPA: metallophosphoesterase [Thermoanaerobaculia bacterium]|nr:metallophosphoesterase [Thermoanaerobaculia bacterium]
MSHLKALAEAVFENPAHRAVVEAHSEYLRASEQKLMAALRGEEPSIDGPGSLEFGAVLYHLHSIAGIASIVAEDIGLPEARLTDAHLQAADAAGLLPRVAGDGSLIGFGKWEAFDTGWLQAFGNYVLLKLGKIKKHAFNATPAQIPLPSSCTIAIVGDWGTGNWDDGSETAPALAVMQQVIKLKPNYTIHLGDVYYSGTQAEEDANYVKFWQAATAGSFMLNSNHEMYDGANGYFDIGLAAPFFKQQKNTSYFVLMNSDIAVIGLDSAYGDPSTLFMQGAIPSSSPQVPWLQGLNLGSRRVIALTHHTGVSTSGSSTTGLWHDMMSALGRSPDYWYWGHIHNGIVYKDRNENGATVYPRCTGQAAIPFGDGKTIPNAGYVKYYANTPNPNAPPQGLRVNNGFALLTINGSSVTETWYDQFGNMAWSSST